MKMTWLLQLFVEIIICLPGRNIVSYDAHPDHVNALFDLNSFLGSIPPAAHNSLWFDEPARKRRNWIECNERILSIKSICFWLMSQCHIQEVLEKLKSLLVECNSPANVPAADFYNVQYCPAFERCASLWVSFVSNMRNNSWLFYWWYWIYGVEEKVGKPNYSHALFTFKMTRDFVWCIGYTYKECLKQNDGCFDVFLNAATNASFQFWDVSHFWDLSLPNVELKYLFGAVFEGFLSFGVDCLIFVTFKIFWLD